MNVHIKSIIVLLSVFTAVALIGFEAIAQTNSNELVQSIHANAVQQVVESGSAVGNPYLYNGRRFEPETGLYYNRARYYNPDQGRFISRDPIGSFGDEMNFGNAYGYVGNSPLSLSDPSGLKQYKIKTYFCPSGASFSGTSCNASAWGAGGGQSLIIGSPKICPVDMRSKKIYVGNLPFAQSSTSGAGSEQHKIYDYSQGFADDETALAYKYWWKNKSTGTAIRSETLNNKYTDNVNHASRAGAGGVRYIADDIGSGVHTHSREKVIWVKLQMRNQLPGGGTAAVGQILRDFSGWTSAHGPAHSGNTLYSLHRRQKLAGNDSAAAGFTTSFGIKFIKTTRASASGGYTEGPIIVDDDDD